MYGGSSLSKQGPTAQTVLVGTASNEVLKSIESLQRFYKDNNELKYYVTSTDSDSCGFIVTIV